MARAKSYWLDEALIVSFAAYAKAQGLSASQACTAALWAYMQSKNTIDKQRLGYFDASKVPPLDEPDRLKVKFKGFLDLLVHEEYNK